MATKKPATFQDSDFIDVEELKLIVEEAKTNNTNLSLLTKETRKMVKDLNVRTRWGVILGFIGTMATVLALTFTHQAKLINILRLDLDRTQIELKQTQAEMEAMGAWKTETNARITALDNRKIGANQ